MIICRFSSEENLEPLYGLVEGQEIRPLPEDVLIEAPFLRSTKKSHGLDQVKILPPVAPSKIVCVGRNYNEHAAELGNTMPDEPLLFLKAPSTIIGHRDSIQLPQISKRVEHEGELAVVIGRTARHLSATDDPLAYVLGYCCANDVTARDLQKKDVQFTRAKSFDTFFPIGPFIVTDVDPLDLCIETRVNGQTRQSGRSSQMAFNIPFLIRYISHCMTLEPGDVISTGTPSGVGPLLEGDTVEVEVEQIGVLSNPVQLVVS